ncbi:MAG TPA: hypothetical protein V6D12_13775 [Candidatus Obscuribacterales bacterium]
MPAPKGNKNAASVWYKKEIPERLVMIGTKVTEETARQLDASLKPGETRSALIRNLIEAEIERRTEAIASTENSLKTKKPATGRG